MRQLLVILLSFAFVGMSFAQTFKAKIDKKKVGLGKTVTVTYTLDGDGDNFKAPVFDGFSIMSGPNQSSSLSIINGNYSQTMSISYVLRSNQEGTFTFDAAQIEVDGELLPSNELTVEVIKGYTGSPNKGRKQQQRNVYDEMSDKIFVRAIANKESVYIGEPVVLTYKVYLSTNNVRTYDVPDVPSYNGFWAQDIKIPQINLKQERYKGKTYNVGVIKRVLLTPQKTGKLEIDPLNVEFLVRVRTKGFGFFDNFKDVNVPISSNESKITVNALPKGKPSNFSGAVGSFRMDTKLNEEEINVNDAVTLKVKISGEGNLKFIDVPTVNVPQDIESYDPKESENISIKGSQFVGSKSYEYVLIPRFPGEYKIESVEFSYFDIKDRKYKTITSPEYIIKVKGDAGSNNVVSGPTITNKDQVALIGQDIRFINTLDHGFNEKNSKYFLSVLFWILSIVPFIGLAVAIFLRKQQEHDAQNQDIVRNKKANKLVMKRLSVVNDYLKEGNNEMFYEELLKAIWGYCEDKLMIERSIISKEVVGDKLNELSVEESAIKELTEMIDTCQMARYAPSAGGSMDATYNKAVEVISLIDQQIK